MKEYVFIFIGSAVLYYIAWFFNEIKHEVVFINIASPFRRILVPSGKRTRFTISGAITELFAHISVLVNIIMISQKKFFNSDLDIRVFNRVWVLFAVGMLGTADIIESVLRCKSMKKGKERVSLMIAIGMMGACTLIFFILTAIGMMLYVKGAQWG